jgi:hypothetical protein
MLRHEFELQVQAAGQPELIGNRLAFEIFVMEMSFEESEAKLKGLQMEQAKLELEV